MSSATEFLKNKKDKDESLIVLHNTDITNLLLSLNNYNGFIAPSLSINRVTDAFTDFGDITVIFKPDTLFNGKKSIPSRDNENFVYDSDSYSVRFPDIEFDLYKKEANKLFYELNELNNDCDSSLALWDYKFKNDKEKAFDFLRGLSVFKLKFIRENIDPDYKPKLHKIRIANSTPFAESPKIMKFLKKGLFKEENQNETNFSFLKQLITEEKNLRLEKLHEAKDNYKNSEFMTSSLNRKIDKLEFEYNNIFDEHSNSGFSSSFMRSFSRDQYDIIMNKNYKYDSQKNMDLLNKFIKKHSSEDAFEDFCQQVLNHIYINPHIKLGQKKVEPTEENILKYMKKAGSKAAEETFSTSLGKSRSMSAKRFHSLQDIVDSMRYLDSHSNIKDIRKENSNKFFKIVEKLSPFAESSLDTFEQNDTISEIIGRSSGIDSISRLLKHSGYLDVPNDIIDEVYEFSKDFKFSNVHYFEAKPMRNVSINEIEAIVIPRNTKPEHKAALKSLGIKTIKNYISNDNEDRHRIVQSFSSVYLNENSLKKQSKKTLKSNNIS